MALNRGVGSRLKIVRPFEQLSKRQVMELGRGYPLALHLLVHCPERPAALRPL